MSLPQLRVTRIEIARLFGHFHHVIDLNLQERVTIMHGPNGVGKTVLLRLIAALLSGRLEELTKVPFDTFTISFNDGQQLGFRTQREVTTDDSSPKRKAPSGTLFLRHNGSPEEQQHDITLDAVVLRRRASRIEAETPWLTRIGENAWLDRRSEERLTALDVVSRFHQVLGPSKRPAVYDEPDFLRQIRENVGVLIIEAQRLFRVAAPREWALSELPGTFASTVDEYAKDLQKRIAQALTQYAAVSQSLDQSFPQRLLQSPSQPFQTNELKLRMGQLEDKRKQLKAIYLIDEDYGYPFDVEKLDDLDSTQRTVMTLYVQDTAQKLGVLDDIAKRINLLLLSVNKKFRHKQLRIDRDKGIVAEGTNTSRLSLDSLSSGEQHELVLLYDLLFRARENTLVLIDEPELSLHVSWQKMFLPDLLEIVATTGIDVLLATHSPFIVGDRSDLMISLSSEERQ